MNTPIPIRTIQPHTPQQQQPKPRISNYYKYQCLLVVVMLAMFLYFGRNNAVSTLKLSGRNIFSSDNAVSTSKELNPDSGVESDIMTDESQRGLRPEGPLKNVLVTGGAGYIATHTIICLLQAGYDVTVVDNLVNSNKEALNRVKKILSLDINSTRISFHQVDLCDKAALEKVFKSASTPFNSCIHFAGLKAVGESVEKPLLYYNNNLLGTINLLALMDKYNSRSLVFSSSATVYGSAKVPITEETSTGVGITNPYGRTKYMIEDILKDFKKAKDLANAKNPSGPLAAWSIVILRYFNPVGAHPSGLIGEDPNGIPNNLMPYILQVAVGKRKQLTVFGSDYPTKDGTGVRDYIHVMDLAAGHVAALSYLNRPLRNLLKGNSTTGKPNGRGAGSYREYSVFNLGTGKGYTVMDIINAMKKASGKPIPYELGPRREGDIAVCYADVSKSLKMLKWSARRTLDDMCRDGWKWQSQNPNGFKVTTPTPA